MQLRGYDLRYLLTSLVLDAGGDASTDELRRTVERLGVDLGPDPRRRLYGSLRSEVRTGRLRRLGGGRYGVDTIPRSTRSHILRRVSVIHEALRAGASDPPPRPCSSARVATAPAEFTWLDALVSSNSGYDQPLRDVRPDRHLEF